MVSATAYCALRQGGAVVCWGASYADINLSGPLTDFEQVTHVGAGMLHQCLVEQGVPWCWGRVGNDSPNILGDTPTAIAGALHPIIDIDGGWYHTCALTDDYRVFCVGDDEFSQSGAGDSAEFVEALGF